MSSASHSENDRIDKGEASITGTQIDRSLVSTSHFTDETQRSLESRHISLLAIGGTIGTLLFVQIGTPLTQGGPGSMLIAFVIWSTVILAFNNCLAEMVVWMPISSPFVHHFVDPALGFCTGWIYFLTQATALPFEIVAFNLILRYWSDKIPVEVMTSVLIVTYILLNFFAVRFYGESEFWLSMGKVILMIGLIAFTFFAMIGVNPLHDRFGFRYWRSKNVPGAPFAEYITTGPLGHFHGFAACLIQAALIIVGPDYVAIAAGEAKEPRKTMPRAFQTTIHRLTSFFILGAFCVGSLLPYSDPDLVKSVTDPQPGVGASPFVIAMRRLNIKVLPDIVNVLVLTSVFSAGNTYFYIGSRILFGLALEGKAPKILAKCTKKGVPIYSVIIMVFFSLLAFMQVSEKGTIVLNWLLNLLSSAGILARAFISLAYIRFYKAMKIQGQSREQLPYRTRFQPFCGYYSMIALTFTVFVYQYPLFLKGRWSTNTFIFSYGILVIMPILYFGYKVWKKTKVRYADHFVDPALGFCAGINFFVFEAALIPFEVVAFNVVIKFWTDKIPLVAVICFMIVTYALLNLFAVKYYGEAEFWLALGKAILAAGLICFTFITMVGGNPHKDAYGFRYWNPSKVSGAPFAEYIEEGNLGRFMGFLACLISASFTIAGPDYVAMTAGEAQQPRSVLPQAFNSVFYRLTTFFVLGSLCIGIVVPYNDPNLLNAISDARPGAGASPYTIAMQRLGIPVAPHIVNALVLTAIYSAGNSYVYCASRTLYGLALEGKMPRFLTRSFLQVSESASIVLTWFVNLVTASQLLNYACIAFTYTRFYAALKRQGISRETLPHKSFWQPFSAYYALAGTLTMAFVGGYTVFLPGNWNIPSFLFSYAMIGACPILFIGWKIVHKTKWQRLEKIDFFKKERYDVDEYERSLTEESRWRIIPLKLLIQKFDYDYGPRLE
ncbi:General amino acid permease AGP2 [Leucoagaricus sp. SymC.cos]|nr:General amino acid permease AGP2 [Leucoagaricus sp. SymC.cos]